MSFTVEKDFTFEFAHVLPNHDGKCARLHGHSGKCTLVLAARSLYESGPKIGMLYDYGDIKKVMEPILENYLDHHLVNTTTKLQNPTSEELAKWIYDRVKPLLPLLSEVIVHETCTARASYREDRVL